MFDAAITGGGLAGCHAAITLAQRGRRVVLLEAKAYPHAKVCGEFLSPECVALFSETGFLPTLQALNPATIRTVRITAADGSAWQTTLPAPAFGISRYALDAALAQYAAEQGVEVRDGARVTQIDGNLSDGFSLSVRTAEGAQTITARVVIAAHGKRSNLDRAMKRAFLAQPQGYIGLKRHFRGAALPEHIDLYVFRSGYCGMSEIEDSAINVCLLVRQDVFQAAARAGAGGDDVERFIAWMGGQNAELGAWLAGATPIDAAWLSIAQVPFVAKTCVEGDVLMAGDSAGLVAPLAGDGMAMALHSGKLAALDCEDYLAGRVTAAAFKRAYQVQWRATFAGRLRLGRALQAIMLRPTLIAPGLRLLDRFPALGDLLVAQTRDLGLVEG